MLEFVRRFRPLLDRPTKRRLVVASAGAVVVAGIEALGLVLLVPLVQVITQANTGKIPSSAQWVADLLDRPTPLSVAAVLGGVVFTVFVVKGIASLVYLRWSLRFILDAEVAMSRRLLSAYLYAPYPFHLERNSSELQRGVHDNVRRVYQDVVVAFVGGVADAILIASVAVVLFVIEPFVAACALVYFVLVGLGYQRLIHGRARAAGTEIVENISESYRVVQQSLGAIKDVQIRHSQEVFIDELDHIKRRSARRFRTLLILNQAPRYYLEVALILGVGLMAGALYPLRSVSDATAVLTLFLAAGFRLLPSLNRVLVAVTAIRAGQPALDQIAADLAALERVARPEPVPDVAALGPATISFHSVSFAYGPALPSVLRDVSLDIAPGESVGFVGPSGAGKSTLLDLLLGLLAPTAGEIDVAGRPLDDVREPWHRSIGYVPQDVVLLDETLRANVALGIPPADIDDERVAEVLETAQLTESVAMLADGLNTKLGERGVRLSGGQRQRVGIARALYANPSVLVLDEATSSLDSATEARITDTIESLQGALTLVIVTHRLSTVRGCDRIYVLDGGRIAAVGAFDELAASNERFAELVELSSVGADGAP